MDGNRQLLEYLSKRPSLFAPSTSKFWDDAHISKGMLEAHLDPLSDAATRKLSFVEKSVDWIAEITRPLERPMLLDMGSGPGIYAELLANKGFCVQGIDISPRSIEYAKQNAARKGKNITYMCQDYLKAEFTDMFDVITLIYCDFGVLSPKQRMALLRKARKMLNPNGILIFDVFSTKEYESRQEASKWSYHDSGYWREAPYACFYSLYKYAESFTFAEQYVVVTKEDIACYNIWNHTFTIDELRNELENAGFSDIEFYGDVAGAEYTPESATICAVAGVNKRI